MVDLFAVIKEGQLKRYQVMKEGSHLWVQSAFSGPQSILGTILEYFKVNTASL